MHKYKEKQSNHLHKHIHIYIYIYTNLFVPQVHQGAFVGVRGCALRQLCAQSVAVKAQLGSKVIVLTLDGCVELFFQLLYSSNERVRE